MSTISAQTRLVSSISLILVLLTILDACTPRSAGTPTFDAQTPLLLTIKSSIIAPSTLFPIPLLLAASMQTEAMYSFENYFSGWIPQSHYSTMGCVNALNSDEIAKDGQSSLKLDMNLSGTKEQYRRGEAWVDMRYYPPSAAQNPFVPLDLSGHTITMWVYAPKKTIGDNNRPNGLQIFVKDIHWNGSYSTWTNVTENEWVLLSFPVNSSGVENGYVEDGFDPSQIIAIGAKMAIGGGSDAIYQGPIYIDSVDW